MNIEILTAFFGWMTIINAVLLTWTTIMCLAARKYIQHKHGKWFGLSPEAINAFLYGYLGLYKALFIVFSLVPWIALTLIV